jgi:hypothetical protein
MLVFGALFGLGHVLFTMFLVTLIMFLCWCFHSLGDTPLLMLFVALVYSFTSVLVVLVIFLDPSLSSIIWVENLKR